MKSRLLGLFLALGLLVVIPSAVLSIDVQDEPFEGQDYVKDNLIDEMDEQYTDDEKYLQGEEDHSMPKEEPKAKKEEMNKETQGEDTQNEDAKEEEIFE